VVEGALRSLEESGFDEIAQGIERLRTIGIIRGDYSIDYPNTTGYCTSSRDEYLKEVLLRFAIENFREDFRKMLEASLAYVVFKWEPGFENFLRKGKKRKKVASPGQYPTTATYSRSASRARRSARSRWSTW
jgi:hypothetical protein